MLTLAGRGDDGGNGPLIPSRNQHAGEQRRQSHRTTAREQRVSAGCAPGRSAVGVAAAGKGPAMGMGCREGLIRTSPTPRVLAVIPLEDMDLRTGRRYPRRKPRVTGPPPPVVSSAKRWPDPDPRRGVRTTTHRRVCAGRLPGGDRWRRCLLVRERGQGEKK
ncbi:hypothetical protein PVAP13_4KG108305 [Panicum virgatum]|uniref:Uncharacterized protein n=1 Tax=Panicum virgatum TaxID=38727 RepID=A0A8T0TUU6_PANVG|nr:hypothetical protein PVAP13_4KG108305 [Panicum virgatum]